MSNRPVTIVALTKYAEVLKGFVESVEKFCPGIPRILVTDGLHYEKAFNINASQVTGVWNFIPGPEKFSMAGNGNLGLKAVPNDHDILYCGDDIRFLEENTIERLQEIAYKDETVGLLSPRLMGRASPTLANPKFEITFVRPLEMWFPCIYIKREVLNKVGYLDERFSDFGSDDLDYCIRTLLAGYSLAATPRVVVQHDASPEGGPTTFVKNIGMDKWVAQEKESYAKIKNKYGVDTKTFNEFLSTGNLELLKTNAVAQMQIPDAVKEKARENIKGRSLYIATPAYGGIMTTNYVESLLGLLNLCTNMGIFYELGFVRNESLITRARNKMVDGFMRKSKCTDFVFIDADIGFDPRGVLSLLLYNEGVIGAPCVRKNLRLDRVVRAARSNPDKNYTQDELELLCGEFVLNFHPDNTPSSIQLGCLLEVKDSGTGIMRIRREVFEKFREHYPEKMYEPAHGEDGDPISPMCMYFQADLDPDSAKYTTSGLPIYISEDYGFCRDCRNMGTKIYIAPWINTTHMGSYLFRGNMSSVSAAKGTIR